MKGDEGMREIKFRAWDKYTEEMWNVETLHIEDEYVDLFKTNIYEKPLENPWAKISDVILMQYTGLKDKNGVEIYEGDIVRVFDAKQINRLGRDGAYVDAYLDELDEVDFIVFKDGGFVLNRTGLDVSICQSIEEFTVIGSICETPELLETKKD